MKNKSFYESFYHAFVGIVTAFKRERNFKFHVLMAVLAILFTIIAGFDLQSIGMVIILCTLVLTMELVNTSIEALIDLVCGDQRNPLAKIAKDVAAGAVLMAAVTAIIVGGIILWDQLAPPLGG